MIKFKIKTDAPLKAHVIDPKAPSAPIDHEPVFPIKNFPQNHILYHIHKNGTRQTQPRHHNRVHSSDLDPTRKWCAREAALLTKHGKKRKGDFASTATRMTWGMGYKGADLLMEFIPAEKIWGDWKCVACKHKMERCYTPPKCEKCGGDRRALQYQEVFLQDPVTQVVGSVDLFVDILGNGMKTPVEIKTEGNYSFKARTMATFDHEWRTMLYLYLIEKSPWTSKYGLNHQSARVMYFTKEGYADEPKIKEWKLGDWAKSSVKEYWINRNDDMIANQIEYAASYRNWRNHWDMATNMGHGPEAPPMPPLPDRVDTGTSPTCTRCKGCPAKLECWKGAAL